MRILIVEDSERLRESISDGLSKCGYAIDTAADGRRGLIFASTTEYDTIILDLMLPELDGLSLLRKLREDGSTTPVLILSARDRIEQRVDGLRCGADDYLVKPFSFDELVARIEALCRRSRGVAANEINIRGIRLDLAAKRFTVDDDELALPPREYAILEFLFLNAGRTVSRPELEEHVYSAERQVWSNAVDSAIAAIRRRLGALGLTDLIETRRGRGYLIASPRDAA